MKKKLIYTILAVLFCLGLFLIIQPRIKNITQKKSPPIYVPQNLFHPDEVLEVNFVFEQSKFQFKRTQRLEFWSKDPHTTSKVHQTLLMLSSMMPQKASASEIKQLIRIAIKTDDLTDWIWVSDGENYRWDSGPHQSKGGPLTEEQKAFFASRESLFVNQKGSFCQKRPIQFTMDQKTLLHQKGTWFLSGQIYSDQNSIEKWLGKNCQFQIKNLISEQVAPQLEKQLDNKMKITEINKKFRHIQWSESGFILIEESGRKKMIYDPSLVEELFLMKSILAQAKI